MLSILNIRHLKVLNKNMQIVKNMNIFVDFWVFNPLSYTRQSETQ